MSQARHWDHVTAELVTPRLAAPPPLAFFHPAEQDCAGALLKLLAGQELAGQEDEPGIPVLEMVDARLAAAETDGWRYADMPEDGQASARPGGTPWPIWTTTPSSAARPRSPARRARTRWP